MISEKHLEAMVRMGLFMQQSKRGNPGPKPPPGGGHGRDANQWNIDLEEPGAEERFEQQVEEAMERIKKQLDVG